MAELPVDLMTPVFGNIYKRRCEQPRIDSITSIEWPSPIHFHETIAPAGYPVVFRFNRVSGGGRCLEKLRAEMGANVVQVRINNYASPEIYAKDRQYTDMSLNEYIEDLKFPTSGLPGYAGNQKLPSVTAQELGAPCPEFYPASAYESPSYWLGGPGSVTPLHKDSTDNFVYQLLGVKRWTLYPVRDVTHLYLSRPDKSDDMDFATSKVDLRRPDSTRFPQLNLAKAISVDLRDGEMLYLPAGWAHYVETLTTSLTINHWLSKAYFRTLTIGGS